VGAIYDSRRLHETNMKFTKLRLSGSQQSRSAKMREYRMKFTFRSVAHGGRQGQRLTLPKRPFIASYSTIVFSTQQPGLLVIGQDDDAPWECSLEIASMALIAK
jgi:hypothetical protein